MREVLFRAKRISDDKWIEGYYVDQYNAPQIYIPGGAVGEYYFDRYHIDTSTLCQFTGLCDKNGRKIWENDIVAFKHEKFVFDDGLEPWERTCLPNKKEYRRNYVVEFCNTPTNYGLRFRNGSIWFMVHRMTVVMHDVEVIGNVFDNPELLEKAR